MIYYQNHKCILHHGDVIDCLRQLEPESVQCVVTSPPYWNLRDYGIEGQLGLEQTIEQFVEKMVAVFREVRRVLRKDGTVWLNIGDSYASGSGRSDEGFNERWHGKQYLSKKQGDADRTRPARPKSDLKHKDLCLIPFRLALALQADGWWVRSDIIWAKPNPMPESVTDRPTTAHEHVFLLAKSANYYYDADAVREPFNYPERTYNPDTSNHKTAALKEQGNRCTSGLHDGRSQYGNPAVGRNLRTVWTIPTKAYSEAHFATFPEKLVEPCVLAGTSERGACAKCGSPWNRVVERRPMVIRKGPKSGSYGSRTTDGLSGTMISPASTRTLDWTPTCSCQCDTVRPCVVLDPFHGSGTTGLVALRLGRHYIGIDLSEDYLDMSLRRLDAMLAQDALPLDP